jgi:hypothetical protein
VLEAFRQAEKHYYKKRTQEKQNAIGLGKSLPEVLQGISPRSVVTRLAPWLAVRERRLLLAPAGSHRPSQASVADTRRAANPICARLG